MSRLLIVLTVVLIWPLFALGQKPWPKLGKSSSWVPGVYCLSIGVAAKGTENAPDYADRFASFALRTYGSGVFLKKLNGRGREGVPDYFSCSHAVLSLIPKVPPGSMLLLYFGGHGIRPVGGSVERRRRGDLFLCCDGVDPWKVPQKIAEDPVPNSISFAALIQSLRATTGVYICAFLDCCYSGPAQGQVSAAVEKELGSRGFLMGATAASRPAYKLAFSDALMTELEQGPDNTCARELFLKVRGITEGKYASPRMWFGWQFERKWRSPQKDESSLLVLELGFRLKKELYVQVRRGGDSGVWLPSAPGGYPHLRVPAALEADCPWFIMAVDPGEIEVRLVGPTARLKPVWQSDKVYAQAGVNSFKVRPLNQVQNAHFVIEETRRPAVEFAAMGRHSERLAEVVSANGWDASRFNWAAAQAYLDAGDRKKAVEFAQRVVKAPKSGNDLPYGTFGGNDLDRYRDQVLKYSFAFAKGAKPPRPEMTIPAVFPLQDMVKDIAADLVEFKMPEGAIRGVEFGAEKARSPRERRELLDLATIVALQSNDSAAVARISRKTPSRTFLPAEGGIKSSGLLRAYRDPIIVHALASMGTAQSAATKLAFVEGIIGDLVETNAAGQIEMKEGWDKSLAASFQSEESRGVALALAVRAIDTVEVKAQEVAEGVASKSERAKHMGVVKRLLFASVGAAGMPQAVDDVLVGDLAESIGEVVAAAFLLRLLE